MKVAILRGINVGGKRKILMADLKSMFEKAKFRNVSSYIQSGNVFFDSVSSKDNLQLAQQIESLILDEFGFEVPVIVRTHQEIKSLVSENPFYKNHTPIENLHLTFLGGTPNSDNVKNIKTLNFKPDDFIVQTSNVYIHCVGKYHQSKLTNNFFEKKLGINASTRNWKTVLKLLELSEDK